DFIRDIDADIIAVQEINSSFALADAISNVPNWDGKIYSKNTLKLGFLYKDTEVTITDLTILFEDDTDNFPRPAVLTVAKHISSNEEIILINLHLKCCEGPTNQQRRQTALSKLKSHVDGLYPDKNVIILGDFNDSLTDVPGQNVFQLFLEDIDNFSFADMEIANGPETNWSYPAYPSHIDHFIISNELFLRKKAVESLMYEDCLGTYFTDISDHRPQLLTLNFN
ncbi:MAG: endonuclease/exonuclease/phosphatase family protein, partial [Cyclobacteriaceae bacterium]|nr:endonuclease/exonuclease/phosphatase family protein [Cyclobacteriaceae bacterium]